MGKRLFDFVVAATGLIVCAPVILVAAIAIRVSSQGPVFYRASRVGKDGHRFEMFKLRTMHCRRVSGSSITAAGDRRVFVVGRILRSLKIDELPQLWNILKGEMSVVGPRPEAVDIVEHYYSCEYQQTLNVRPGLLSPGSVFYYTHGEQLLAASDIDPEQLYVTRLLPQKMALELQYLRQQTPWSDLKVILFTAAVLIQKAAGRKNFPLPPPLRPVTPLTDMAPRAAA